MKFLVFSPHPDDLDFGCGGTLAKLSDQGNKVEACIVTDGSKGGSTDMEVDKLVETRKQEQLKSAEILGLEEVHFLNEKDGEVENTKSLREKMVRKIRKLKPDVVLSFDPANRNFDNRYVAHRDHREVSRAVFDSVSPASKNSSYFPEHIDRGLEPHRVGEMWFFGTRRPDKRLDIEDTFERKLEAILSHESQIDDTEELRETVERRAREMGGEEFRYAENFRVLEV
ncbi:MAG: PIG-L deacetylase family protein [Candidatus Nanohaloarchaea archaeon]|nr:PIG-L deacetylase family protein [Candidatus Nanohaloarchaea archaeon]